MLVSGREGGREGGGGEKGERMFVGSRHRMVGLRPRCLELAQDGTSIYGDAWASLAAVFVGDREGRGCCEPRS